MLREEFSYRPSLKVRAAAAALRQQRPSPIEVLPAGVAVLRRRVRGVQDHLCLRRHPPVPQQAPGTLEAAARRAAQGGDGGLPPERSAAGQAVAEASAREEAVSRPEGGQAVTAAAGGAPRALCGAAACRPGARHARPVQSNLWSGVRPWRRARGRSAASAVAEQWEQSRRRRNGADSSGTDVHAQRSVRSGNRQLRAGGGHRAELGPGPIGFGRGLVGRPAGFGARARFV